MISRLRPAAGVLAFGLVAAVAAALLAHFAIDALGDVALPRDAYDGLSHGSRGLMALGLLLGSGALAIRLIVAALDGAAGRDRIAQALSAPASPLLFVGPVVLGALVLLIGMESLDALVATGGVASFGDALGGSVVLGLGLAGGVAVVLGVTAFGALRWFARWHAEVLRAIGAVFAIFLLPPPVRAFTVARLYVGVGRSTAVLRRAAKRGPPAFLFA